MTPEQLQNYFDSFSGGREALDPDETREVFKLLDQPGFGLLWQLLIGMRQTQYVRLAHMPNFEPAQQYQTAVIQGHIKGIESLYQTLLELTKPHAGDAAEGALK